MQGFWNLPKSSGARRKGGGGKEQKFEGKNPILKQFG